MDAPPVLKPVEPWRPRALTKEEWPPNYTGVYVWRMQQLAWMRANPARILGAKAYYAKPEHCAEFIQDWMDTYDPRKATMKWIPFVFFQRQHEFVEFILAMLLAQEGGLTEKCRDMGITWLACAVSVWAWLFVPDFAVGWGSKDQKAVDEIGILDSIFEKIRVLVDRIPDVFLPAGFIREKNLMFMRIINPENGSTIGGEVGDNIGRGGRKSIYFKDESAHYEHADKIEASLGDNTRVQIDISSVNGLGNQFYKRRSAGVEWYPGKSIEPGKTHVFIADWRDHPEKTPEWYNLRRAKWESEGLLHKFAQEVDRDYAASLANTVIPRAHIQAAIDAHITLGLPIEGGYGASLDVADEGGDTNAGGIRQDILLFEADEWGERDPGVSARRMMGMLKPYRGIECQYDSIGVGTNVKSEYNRLTIDPDPATGKPVITTADFIMVPWDAGSRVIDGNQRLIPDDPLSPRIKDFFENMKAQAWWSLARRFYRTFQAVQMHKAGLRHNFNPADLISLSSKLKLLRKIEDELAQVVFVQSGRLKTMIDKKPNGARSPNLADMVVMLYFPMMANSGEMTVGSYGQ